MAKLIINNGTSANDGTGDPLRNAAAKINANFDEIYTSIGNGTTISFSAEYTLDTGNALQWVEGTYDFGNNIIKYANVIQAESELANYSPATYHGMTMHVHETGALYFAHAGVWRKLLSDNADGDAAAAGYVDSLSTVAYEGDLGSLTDVSTTGATDGQVLKYNDANSTWEPASDLTADSGSGIELTNLSVNVGTAGTPNLEYNNSTGVFSYTPPDVGELSYTPDSGNALQWVVGTYDFGNNIIKYANVIQAESELANYSPATYHGMTMHVHETGALYFAHAGAWRKLLTDNADGDAAAAGYVDSLSAVAYSGTLDSLTDVSTTGATNGQILKYNGTQWVPAADQTSAGGASELNDLTDVNTTGVTSGQVLVYNVNSGQFEPETISSGSTNFGDLTDVSAANINVNDIFESAIVTLRVNNDGASAYTFNSHYSGNNPTIFALSGTTIAFDLSQIGGHPFEIRDTGGTAISAGLVHVSTTGTVSTGSNAQGQESGTLYWRIQESISGNYGYICQFHGNMAGTITVKRFSTL